MGQLVLENMEFYAHHGHFDEEQTIGGRFTVDLVIDTDFSKAAETDNLEDAVDYSLVYEMVKDRDGKTLPPSGTSGPTNCGCRVYRFGSYFKGNGDCLEVKSGHWWQYEQV